MSSESTAATLSSLSHIVVIADSAMTSLIPAISCAALKAFGFIIISKWRLLFLTIILCLLLGMGLPTTANYVVVASLMATVLVDVGNASGFIFPLIAVHLFVFYFGLMADVTPPVGLASYAAAGISGGDP